MAVSLTDASKSSLAGPFSQTSVFGRCARTQPRPLYQKFHRRVYNDRLSELERATFIWRSSAVAGFIPRTAKPKPPKAVWLIYTDAASTPPRLRGLLFKGNSDRPDIRALCSDSMEVAWSYLFRYTNLIFGVELLSIVLFLEEWGPILRGRCCRACLGRNN